MSSTDKQEKKPLTLALKQVEVKPDVAVAPTATPTPVVAKTPAQIPDQVSDEAKAKLIAHAKQLNQNYNEKKDEINAEREARRKEHEQRVEENRQKGSNALFEHLKSLIPEKIKTYAGYGKTEARIFEFTFGEEIKFENCFAKDLLSKGSVIKDLQTWLDDEHADVDADGKKHRAFLVYFNMVGRLQYDRTANKFAVFVNWDESSWPSILERVERGSQVRTRSQGDGSTRRRGGPRSHGPPRERRQPRSPFGESQVIDADQSTDSKTETFERPSGGRGGYRGGRGRGTRGGTRGARGTRGGTRGGGRGATRGDSQPRQNYHQKADENQPVPTTHDESVHE